MSHLFFLFVIPILVVRFIVLGKDRRVFEQIDFYKTNQTPFGQRTYKHQVYFIFSLFAIAYSFLILLTDQWFIVAPILLLSYGFNRLPIKKNKYYYIVPFYAFITFLWFLILLNHYHLNITFTQIVKGTWNQ